MKTIQRQAETKARLDVIAAEMGESSRSQASGSNRDFAE